MTENAIKQFDMSAVQARVQESIKAQFAMLIGDQAFDTLVATAIQEFFYTEKEHEVQEVRVTTGYSHGTKYMLTQAITGFQAMVWEELKPHVRSALKEWTSSESKKIKEEIQAVFDTQAPELASSVFHLNVEKLALEMSKRAHLTILEQAMYQTSAQYTQLDANLRSLKMQIGLPT